MPPDNPNVWGEVFSPLGQAIAFFGGLGGLVNALVTRKPWKETVRVVTVGVAVAFGLGTISPHILSKVLPELAEVGGAALGVLTASAFVVGLIAVALVERVMGRATREVRNEDGS
ncbi:hypothetical protein [Defluviimonas sp. SAOS-178_SWC]|uniref:hypothetical protein n=1 Tax=Defluviimonas sp. SAOS-178_SWC TaxID=3121287 RepID=UPI003221DD49